MRPRSIGQGPDRWETRAHAAMGAAAVVALGLFLGSLARVSDEGGRIAQALQQRPGAPAGALIATEDPTTNQMGKPAALITPRPGSKASPTVAGPM